MHPFREFRGAYYLNDLSAPFVQSLFNPFNCLFDDDDAQKLFLAGTKKEFAGLA
jgi:hypothetical protein